MPIRPSDSDTSLTEGVGFVVSGPLFDETLAAPAEALTLAVSFSEPLAAQSESSFTGHAWYWLYSASGTSNVSNTGNANGANDSSYATCTTTALGATTSRLTAECGGVANDDVSYDFCVFRGWFDASTPLLTSSCSIVAHATDASYSDITIYSLSSLLGSFNSDSGTFTFDLMAAGVNTLAKFQATQILFKTSDAVAGATPAVLRIDAARLEVGAF